jgi:hydroxylamine dehydrogenase
MKRFVLGIVIFLMCAGGATGQSIPVSQDTESCIECHASLHPGIVAEWKKSRHALITPEEALKRSSLERRISVEKVPEKLAKNKVGCAECHTLNPESHKDTFEHNDYRVHSVVSPQDCATCHASEVGEYGKNLMAHAYANLVENPVYQDLAGAINGIQSFSKMKTTLNAPDERTSADSCLYCHGTKVQVIGMRKVNTDVGEMEIPLLSGWPNQGVGRLNPDGSKGSCAACHTRHQFSIKMARKPYTCAECHKGPDVPAYAVYKVSKHGNIYSALEKEWDFTAVPWRVGKDFTAPTCATCHVSLLINDTGDIVAKRTHEMNNRLPWRIFGLIYAHPHPKSPSTFLIKNKAGLPLPTELTGEPVAEFLIDEKEQDRRLQNLKKVCLSCHGSGWVNGHFSLLENTIRTTNEMTLTATKIVLSAWEEGVASGLEQKDSIFNEAIEKKWVEQWLFYANSTRFASAMAGADYGAFANGRWYLSKNIQEMLDLIGCKGKLRE